MAVRYKYIGVYGIFYGGECLYIGQSIDIVRRIKNHKQKLNILKHNVEKFNEFMVDNDLSIYDLEFIQLINIKNINQELLNLFEVKLFQYWRPKFYGQSPSSKNNYSKVVANSEVSMGVGRTLKGNNSRTRTGITKRINGKTIWVKSCLGCGVIFDGTSPTSTYCSDSCRISSNYYSKNCTDCGVSFKAKYKNTSYCKNCKYNHNKPKEVLTLKCRGCGEVFTSVYGRQKFCTQTCKSNYFNNSKMVDKSCSVCGVSYWGVNNSKRCADCKVNNLYKVTCKTLHCMNSYMSNSPRRGYCFGCRRV